MSSALRNHGPKPLDMLLSHCAELPRAGGRKPVLERLRDKIGGELTRLLLFALAGNQRPRPARRPA